MVRRQVLLIRDGNIAAELAVALKSQELQNHLAEEWKPEESGHNNHGCDLLRKRDALSDRPDDF